MALDNPAFSRNPAFSQQGAVAAAQDVSAQQLQEMYDRPTTLPDAEVMTVENTISKTVASFGVLLVGAAAGFALTPTMPGCSGSAPSSASCSRWSTSSSASPRPR